jgi:hypothetical protein
MYRHLVSTSLFVTLVLTACSSNDLQTLNSNESAKFQQNLASLGRIPVAVSNAANQSHAIGADPQQVAMTQYLANAQSAGNCSLSDNLASMLYNSAAQIPQNWNFHSSISGTNCPVQMSLTANTSLDLGGAAGVGTFDWTFSSTDASFLALNDIDNVNITGTITGTPNGSGALSIAGTIHSQKNGTLPIYATWTETNATSVQATVGIKYPNYTAELELSLKTAAKSQPTFTLQLNNQALSPQDVATYLADLFPGSLSSHMTAK